MFFSEIRKINIDSLLFDVKLIHFRLHTSLFAVLLLANLPLIIMEVLRLFMVKFYRVTCDNDRIEKNENLINCPFGENDSISLSSENGG